MDSDTDHPSDEDIALARQALAACHGDPGERESRLSELSTLLYLRYSDTQDFRCLRESIELEKEALAIPGHALVSELGVAEALGELFEHSGEQADLADAIRVGQDALNLHPKDHPDRARACANLALRYHTRFEHSGDEFLLDAAVNLQREALSLRSKGHPDRLATCMNLALFLTSACDANPDAALLYEAIALEDEARRICPMDDPERAELWSNTAMSRIKLYHILEDLERRDPGDMRLLNEAIRYQKEAIDMAPMDHQNIGGMMNNLGSLLGVKFEETGDVSIMQEIAELRQRALDLEPPNSRKRWRALTLLASVHSNVAYADRNIGTAISCVVEALVSNADSLPRLLHEVADTLLSLAKMRMDNAQRSALLDAYSSAIDLSVLVTGFVLDCDLQLEYLSTCTTLAPGAYMTAMQLGDMATAVTLLDRARGIMWSQMLQVRRPDLQGVPDGLLAELQNLLSDLNGGESSDSDSSSTTDDGEMDWDALAVQRETEHTAQARIHEILREVRLLPGMEGFMRGPTLDALLRTAATHPVVVLVASEIGCHALIVQSGSAPLTPLLLPNITSSDLESLTNKVGSAQLRGLPRPAERGMHISRERRSSLAKLLAKLWECVVQPVLSQLGVMNAEASGERPRIHWCPTGAFTWVPIHAAGVYDGTTQTCCMDYVVSSYTPTLAALIRVQDGAMPVPMAESKIAFIAAARALDEALPTLQQIRCEVTQATTLAEDAGLLVDARGSSAATRDVTVSGLKSAQLVHIACHGIQDDNQPLESAFHLADGTLTVNELIELDLDNAFLAFLSACETAKGDQDQTEEVVHLASAMLFAGFKSVVATMWAMNDADGPIITTLFYKQLFQNSLVNVDDVPRALDHAVKELRDAGAPPERWATFVHIGA